MSEIDPTDELSIRTGLTAAEREALLVPALEQAVKDGMIEWTGEYAANGQKVYRSLIYKSQAV